MKRRSHRPLALGAILAAGLLAGVAGAHAQVQPLLHADRSDGTPVLRLNDDGGFVIRGATAGSVIPFQGTGPRLMWYPMRAALRAGHSETDAWNAAKIGRGSVAFGSDTEASGEHSTALGLNTVASGTASFAAGAQARATGNGAAALGTAQAGGEFAFAAGFGRAIGATATALGAGEARGEGSFAVGRASAQGNHSVALGSFVATQHGSFIFGDESGTAQNIVANTASNQFMVRAAGGTVFYSNAARTAGVSLAAGAGAWASVSDRERKENFRELDGEAVLAKIRALPVPEWNYRSQDASVRRVGPMAQDFRAAFGLGDNDLTITTTDISGVNMLAIQALERRTADLEAVRAELRAVHDGLRQTRHALAEARAEIAALREQAARMAALPAGDPSSEGTTR